MELFEESVNDHKRIKISSSSLQSYEKYIERLATFQIPLWFGKSNILSPIECAKYGWCSYDKDTLKCSTCSNKLHVMQQQQQQLKINLTESHRGNCPWRTASVSDETIYINTVDKLKLFEIYEEYRKTYEACKNIPAIAESLIDEYSLQDVYSDVRQQNVFILAACGWFYVKKFDEIKCEKCLRRIGLWLYKSLNFKSDTVETSSNEEKNEKILNPLKQHYEWCPWLKKEDDINQAAFEIMIEIVKDVKQDNLNTSGSKKVKSMNVSFEKMKSTQNLLTNCVASYLLD